MEPFLLIDREDAIVTVTLNRPQERNAISEAAHIAELVDFCDWATAEQGLKAIVLTGAGSAFCAGGNVKNMRERSGMFAGSPYELRNKYRKGIQLIPQALYELEVPIIAAINGPAIGAGLIWPACATFGSHPKARYSLKVSPSLASFPETAAHGCCRASSAWPGPR